MVDILDILKEVAGGSTPGIIVVWGTVPGPDHYLIWIHDRNLSLSPAQRLNRGARHCPGRIPTTDRHAALHSFRRLRSRVYVYWMKMKWPCVKSTLTLRLNRDSLNKIKNQNNVSCRFSPFLLSTICHVTTCIPALFLFFVSLRGQVPPSPFLWALSKVACHSHNRLYDIHCKVRTGNTYTLF